MRLNYRISELQYKLLNSITSLNFSLFRHIQRWIIFSISVRLKVVKDNITETSLICGHFNSFSLSIEEKILLPFYLKFSLLSSVAFISLDDYFTDSSFFNLYEKCLESLWYVSVSPYLEYNSDRNSFGFRPYRRSEDVFFYLKNVFRKNLIPYSILNIKFSLFLGLGLDSQNWFINILGSNKGILKNWLKRVVYLKNSSYHIDIANMTNFIFISALRSSINGLVIITKSLPSFDLFAFKYYFPFRFLRYLNTFFIFSLGVSSLFHFFSFLDEFLSFRGLKILKSEVKFSNIFIGFNFMGWKFCYLKNNFFGSVVSHFTVIVHKRNLKTLLKSFKGSDIFLLIKRVNYIVSYWINNYSFSYSLWDISAELDVYLNKLFWIFVKRRHSRKNNIWIYSKYWKFLMGRFYFYSLNPLSGNICFLKSHNLIKSKIYRLPSSLNIYLIPDLFKLNILWYKKISVLFTGLFKLLYINQYGICPYCNNFINKLSFAKIRILRFSWSNPLFSGKFSKLILLHVNCQII
uniref:RoaA n=1 Tax=Cryptoglena skujai TaxID=161229 RepID=A0A0G3SFK5_9EUGL|nr:RoaA [Cryptoglena skujai]AKL39036.1 RoaA [Cryptoglena skujai]